MHECSFPTLSSTTPGFLNILSLSIFYLLIVAKNVTRFVILATQALHHCVILPALLKVCVWVVGIF
jgi:hypothetical protein